MGHTFRPEEGRGGDAMEGKFCYGRTDVLCDSAQRRGEHDLVVPRVWDFPQDGITRSWSALSVGATKLPTSARAALKAIQNAGNKAFQSMRFRFVSQVLRWHIAYSECKVRAGSMLTILIVGVRAARLEHKMIIKDVRHMIHGSSGLIP